MSPSEVTPLARRLIDRVKNWRITRVYQRYAQKHGELLASGMSVNALFSVFAALYVGFAIAGLYLEGAPTVRDSFITLVNTNAPGLIDTGNGGAINLDDLFGARLLGWSGIVAAAILTVTALTWLSATRDAVRAIFDLPAEKTFFLLLKLKDLALIIGFGIAMIISATISVISTSALTFVLNLFGARTGSPILHWTLVAAGLLLVLALDTVVLGVLFRVLSGVVIPWRRLVAGSLFGAVGLGILKVLGTALIGGARTNPLLTSFAIIIGLLIWFSLVCRVILLAAAWIAVDMKDHGLTGAKLTREQRARDKASTLVSGKRIGAAE